MTKRLDELRKFRSFNPLGESERCGYVRYIDQQMIPFLPDVKDLYNKNAVFYSSLIQEKSELKRRLKWNSMVLSTTEFHFSIYKEHIFDDFRFRFYLAQTKYEYHWKILCIYENFRLMTGLYKELILPHMTEMKKRPLIAKFDQLQLCNYQLWHEDLKLLESHWQELQAAYLKNLKTFQSIQINHIKDKSFMGKVRNSVKLITLEIKSRI